jgi:hypothetical protein
MAEAADCRRRTEITVETNQVLIIRRRRSTRGWCRECAREVEIVSLDDTAAIAGINGPLLHESVAQPWHFSDGEKQWVCLESLLTPGGSARRTGSEEDR